MISPYYRRTPPPFSPSISRRYYNTPHRPKKIYGNYKFRSIKEEDIEKEKKELEEIRTDILNKFIEEYRDRLKKIKNRLDDEQIENLSDIEILIKYLVERQASIYGYGHMEGNEKKINFYTIKVSYKDHDDIFKELNLSSEIRLPLMQYNLYIEYFGGLKYGK